MHSSIYMEGDVKDSMICDEISQINKLIANPNTKVIAQIIKIDPCSSNFIEMFDKYKYCDV